MSEFFNITINKDIVLDDSSISDKNGWTSEKIYKEIINKRITKFEELEDVDVVNRKDKQIVAFSSNTGKFTTIDGVEAGELTGTGLRQIEQIGVVGSPENPKIISIPINTTDFKVPKINLLKQEPGEQNVAIENEFLSNDFEEDKNIIFNNKIYFKLEHEFKYDVIEDTEKIREYSAIIDLDQFKIIDKFEEFEDGISKKIKLKAIPSDRILIPKYDLNLSHVEYIDYFELNAIGNNIRIICSIDGGKTWKTFKNEKWIDINLNLNDIKKNGMTKDLFNDINNMFWNELVTTKKIRFAYLISMDEINYIEELESLIIKYNEQGKWIQMKDTDFDVVYASNTLLQVYVKFDGNIKINY